MRQVCRGSKQVERSFHRFPQTLAIGLPTGQRLLPIMVILGSKFCLRRLAANHNSLAPNSKIGAAACPKSDGPTAARRLLAESGWSSCLRRSYSNVQTVVRNCGAPLNGREGRFILKYFLIDRPRRTRLGRASQREKGHKGNCGASTKREGCRRVATAPESNSPA